VSGAGEGRAPDLWVVDEADNVATCIREGGVTAGQEYRLSVGGGPPTPLRVSADVDYGHKVARRAIGEGDEIVKYAMVMGAATEAIAEGAHVHVHNVESLRGRGDRTAESGELRAHRGPWEQWRKRSEVGA
jgi:altronate dehydratase small subunit